MYNGYSQSGSLTTCQDTSLAVFSFLPVKGNNAFYSTELIALKHDSLGQLFSKQYLKFSEAYTLFSCKWYHNKVFVLLSTRLQTGPNASGGNIILLRFSNNLILEKSVALSTFEMTTNNPSVLTEGPDSTLLFSGRVKSPLDGGPGDQFLAHIDFDLNVIQSAELSKQFRYSIPGYSNGSFYWYTYEGLYQLDANFNILSNDSLVDSENTRPSVVAFQEGNNGLHLKIIDNISSQNYSRVVSFNHNHEQQKILFSTKQYLINTNHSNQNSQYYLPFLNGNDSLRMDVFNIIEDSGYVLRQTVSLDDTVFINAKPHIQAYGHYLVEHIASEDASINFLKGVDSIPSSSCLNISFPPDTIIDTAQIVYSFIPRINTPPAISKNIPFTTYQYDIQTLDSLNAAGDSTLPAFEFKCQNKGCSVFAPIGGGLLCNKNQLILRAREINPFNFDSSDFTTTFIWNDVLPQDTFTVYGFDRQTVTLSGENFFCRQTQNITVDFDSVRVNSRHKGDICMDDPQEVELFVSGYFDHINWQNPLFDSDPYQIVSRPGVYPFVVESTKGCRINSAVNVPEKCPPKVFIPNAFTPDGDGTNDTFIGFADFTDEFVFRIYDRWGQVLFTTNTSPIVWDGKYKGEIVQVGIYNWRLVYNSVFQDQLFVKDLFGHVTVVR